MRRTDDASDWGSQSFKFQSCDGMHAAHACEYHPLREGRVQRRENTGIVFLILALYSPLINAGIPCIESCINDKDPRS